MDKAKHIKLIVLIPIYKVKYSKLKQIVFFLKDKVYKIICIDDCCPFKTGQKLKKDKFKNLYIITNKKNLGVGGAMKKGLRFIQKFKYDYAIKIDGDGQLNPKDGLNMAKYAYSNNFDYVVGNRFNEKIKNYKSMPKSRWFGNKILSLFSKISTRQYHLSDFLNGLICISKKNLTKIDLKKIKKNFFFETSMIFENQRIGSKISSFPVRVKYFKDHSNFNPTKEIFRFFTLNIYFFFKRILRDYFIKKISVSTLLILVNLIASYKMIEYLLLGLGANIILKIFFINIFVFFIFMVVEIIENDYFNNKK
jgi:dolichol-phosphate mannosyltransferase